MTTLNDLPDDWKDIALSLYKKGAHDVEIRAAFKLSMNAWNNLMLDSDEFRFIITQGRQLSEAFWYAAGRENLYNKDFQQSLWYRNMQNRFGWRDKSDSVSATELDEDDLDSVEDVEKEIANVVGIRSGEQK